MNFTLPPTSSGSDSTATASARAGSSRTAGVETSFSQLLAQRAQAAVPPTGLALAGGASRQDPAVRTSGSPRVRDDAREPARRPTPQPQRDPLRERDAMSTERPAEHGSSRDERRAGDVSHKNGAGRADATAGRADGRHAGSSTRSDAPDTAPVDAREASADTTSGGVAAGTPSSGDLAADAAAGVAAPIDPTLPNTGTATQTPTVPATMPAAGVADSAAPVPAHAVDTQAIGTDRVTAMPTQPGGSETPASSVRDGAASAPSAVNVKATAKVTLPDPQAASHQASVPEPTVPSGVSAGTGAGAAAGTTASPQRAAPLGVASVLASTASIGVAAAGSPSTHPGAAGSIAGASAAVVSIMVPLFGDDFAPALGARLSVLAQQGIQRAELQLNPAEMGPISVDIALDGTRISVDFGADLGATRQRLESSLPELASALRESGLTLAGGGVHEHRRGRDGGHARSGAGTSARGGVAAGDPMAVAAAPARIDARGVVDLYA